MSHLTAEELGRLIDRYAGPLELFARQWTTDASDVVQESFMALITTNPLPDRPVAWLYRTVRNRALNSLRADRRREHHERQTAKEVTWIATNAMTAIESDELQAALALVPEDQREVIVARLWGDLTYQDIAGIIGTSVSTVHRRYEAGIENLRKRIMSPWTNNATK